MTLTTTYTVTDWDGDSLEIEAIDGSVRVTDREEGTVLLILSADEAFELIGAIDRAIEDALDQEDESDEDDDEADDDTDLVIVDEVQEFSRVIDSIDLGKGSFYIAPAADTYTLNFTTSKLFDDPKIGVAPTVADFFD